MPLESSQAASVRAPVNDSSLPVQPVSPSGLYFVPPTLTLKAGDAVTIGLAISNVDDLFSIPLLIQHNPAVIQIEDIRNGEFLSGGTQEIAIVQRVDQQAGQAIVSATRQPRFCK